MAVAIASLGIKGSIPPMSKKSSRTTSGEQCLYSYHARVRPVRSEKKGSPISSVRRSGGDCIVAVIVVAKTDFRGDRLSDLAADRRPYNWEDDSCVVLRWLKL